MKYKTLVIWVLQTNWVIRVL